MLAVRVLVGGLLLAGLAAPASAQSVSVEPVGGRAVAAPASGPRASLPLRQISIYRNGVALFERVGFVTGDTLIHIDFTTAQLNDVLGSLTAVDLGGGQIAGLGYDNPASFRDQLAALHLNLGNDPTVTEFLNALKGRRVQVRGGALAVTGKLLNVEIKPVVSTRTGDRSERRYVSVVTDGGGLKTVELTPLVEVRVIDAEPRVEIGHYLQILATTHDPPLRHMTLEAKGTGRREIRIRYLGAVPAWKSNYRVLATGAAKTATLQGWAVVENSTDLDWENVRLTLVSGAPQSSPGQAVRDGLTPAGVMGGAGPGVGAMPAKQAAAGSEFQQQARNSLAPETTAVALDDVFELKLDKPVTIRRGESQELPVVQATVEAERVSLWVSRESSQGVQRALWLRNTSPLTLDQGSFTLMEDGVFAGRGQLPLLHAGERRLAAYGQDQELKVSKHEAKDPPFELKHLVIANGVLTGHHKLYRERDFTIENPGAAARTVVLAVEQSANLPHMGPWELDTSAEETVGSEPSGRLYRFQVEVAPHSTQVFQVMESHSHPVRTPIEQLTVENIAGVIHESGDNAEVIAELQPIAEAKKKIAALDAQMREQQKAIDEVNAEEARLRQNIATLKGSNEEKPLARRYADAMLAQEDKLAALEAQREQARQQRAGTQRVLSDQIQKLKTDIVFPQA